MKNQYITLTVAALLLPTALLYAKQDSDEPTQASALTNFSVTPDMDTQQLSETVQKATKHLSEGQGVRLQFAPGIYRVPLNLFVFKEEGNAPLHLVADKPGTTFIRGSKLRTEVFDPAPENWKPVEGFQDVYAINWPYDLPKNRGFWADRYGFPLKREAKRSEILILNGQIMKPREFELYRWQDPDGPFLHMKNRSGNERGKYEFDGIPEEGLRILRPGEFIVTDREDTPEPYRQKLFVRLPRGMTWDQVETVEFGDVGGDYKQALLIIANRRNVLLKNLTVEHAPSEFLGRAVTLENLQDFRIEGCDFSRNGGRGMNLSKVRDGLVTRCTFNENGQKGVGGSMENVVFEHSDFNWNNWRGRYGFVGWDSAGIKIAHSRNVLIRDCNFVGNLTGGVWFDIDNVDVVVERVFVYGNFRPGVEFELTKPGTGGSILRDSVIGENFSYGIFISDSAENHVEGNVVFNNGSQTYGPGLLSPCVGLSSWTGWMCRS